MRVDRLNTKYTEGNTAVGFSQIDRPLLRLASALGERLLADGMRVTSAESCTGGWVMQAITQVAGSSKWFDAGYVTYSNEAKNRTLGVPQSILRHQGAVSEATVVAMTRGLLALEVNSDIAIAISGVAGPAGGTGQNSVGTVWLAWQLRGQPAQAQMFQFRGDRWDVRRRTVATALKGALRLLPSAGGDR